MLYSTALCTVRFFIYSLRLPVIRMSFFYWYSRLHYQCWLRKWQPIRPKISRIDIIVKLLFFCLFFVEFACQFLIYPDRVNAKNVAATLDSNIKLFTPGTRTKDTRGEIRIEPF